MMNETLARFFMLIKSMPPSKKISIAFVIALLIAGFVTLFLLANTVNYQTLFSNLSPQDAGGIIEELKKKNVPYKIGRNGTQIMVPAEDVYDLRLSLVNKGLPKKGNVGFEIFDKTDFKTTQFVQQLNYQRALQGELERTINRFNEVVNSKVFIVQPKESLFIEKTKSVTASIQLELKSNLPPRKLAAIIHLVAGAVEGLNPEQVTVVDTQGRVIFKGGNNDGAAGLLSNMQLDYKAKIENDLRNNIQSMLEGIVGAGKAIVRVNAEIDFNKITLNEEEYDPSVTVVRSKREIEESSQTGNNNTANDQTRINVQTGVVPTGTGTFNGKQKKNVITNYEINKVTRSILKPAGNIKRLSVAAVVDGTYEIKKLADGTFDRKYSARSDAEIARFEALVRGAMGYSEDREDQITVSSIPFFNAWPDGVWAEAETKKFDIFKILNDSKKIIINLFLMALVFFIAIKPLLKTLKNMTTEPVFEKKELTTAQGAVKRIPMTDNMGTKEKMQELTRDNPEKARQVLKNWIGE